jgi:uncharacterized protein (TIGR03643 family)
MQAKKIIASHNLSEHDINRIIEMAWEDRTPFDAIESQFGVAEKEVIELMRENMKPTSWRMWRERVQGRSTKHRKKNSSELSRFRCSRQRSISLNKISKR